MPAPAPPRKRLHKHIFRALARLWRMRAIKHLRRFTGLHQPYSAAPPRISQRKRVRHGIRHLYPTPQQGPRRRGATSFKHAFARKAAGAKRAAPAGGSRPARAKARAVSLLSKKKRIAGVVKSGGSKRRIAAASAATKPKLSAAAAARRRFALSTRYKRMWATRRKLYGKTGRGKKIGKIKKGGRKR